MATERLDIVVSGRGFDRLGRQFGRMDKRIAGATKRAGGFSRAMTSTMRGTRRALQSVHGLGLAIGGAGLVMGARQVLQYQEAMARLRIDAKLTAEEFSEVERAIKGVSSVGIQHTEALAALRVFQDFGGNLRDGVAQLKDLGKLSRATGVDLGQLAQISGTMISNFKIAGKEGSAALVLMKQQGDLANISLATAAGQVPRVMAAAKKAGWTGLGAVRQAFGGFQMMAGQFGSGETAAARGATQFEALISGMIREQVKLRKRGVEVFDKSGVIRKLPELISDIFRKIGSGTKKLGGMFREKEFLDALLSFRGKGDGGLRENVSGIFSAQAGADGVAKMYGEFQKLAPEADRSARAIATLSGQLMEFGGFVAGHVSNLINSSGDLFFEFDNMIKNEAMASIRRRGLPGVALGVGHGGRGGDLRKLAGKFAGGMSGGKSTIEVGDGRGGRKRVALTPETAMTAIQKQADQFNMSAKEFGKLRPVLEGILKAVSRPMAVTGTGLDRPEVVRGRGGGA